MANTKGDAPIGGEVMEREVHISDPRALEALNRSEIDVQIATAKRFPRSVTEFNAEAVALVSMSAEVADECIYALERRDRDEGTKTIEGPSSRFAEILAYSWGNCRADARVVDEEGEFVTARGLFWDLQKNTAIAYEVKRRIVDSRGRRYKPDMIGVTANAACSIALRNAVLKGIPKALWIGAYETARKVIMGDFQTLPARREVVLGNLQKFGISRERVLAKLGVKGVEDISLEHIVVLRGNLTALKEGDSTSPDDLFPPLEPKKEEARGAAAGFSAAMGNDSIDGAKAEEKKPEDTIAGAAAGAAPAAKAPVKKTRGTPKQFKTYLEKLEKSSDLQILAVFMDETSLYDWSDKERDDLSAAYNARKKALEG